MRIRCFLFCALFVVSSLSSFAVNGTWSGSQSTAWTNNANWSASPYPSNDETATFSSTLGNGRYTIDLTGPLWWIQNIIFDGQLTPSYRIGAGGVDAQPLLWRNNGVIRMYATAGNNHVVDASLFCTQDTSSAGYTFQNDSALRTLTHAGRLIVATLGTGSPTKTVYVNGVGEVRLEKGIEWVKATGYFDIQVGNSGRTHLGGASNIVRVLRMNGGAGSILNLSGTLVFTNGGSENLSSSAGGLIRGGRIIFSSSGFESYSDNRVDDPAATLAIESFVSGDPGFEIYSSQGVSGLFDFRCITNDFKGQVIMNAPGGVIASVINNQNMPGCLGAGTKIQFSAGNMTAGPVLRYTGSGEVNNRFLSFNANGRVEQAGTGLLKFTTKPNLPAGMTMLLMGSTTGEGEFSSSFDLAAANITKQGTGTWTLSGASALSGALSVDAGRLILSGAGVATNMTAYTIRSGATLVLRNSAASNSTDRLRNATALSMASGTLVFEHDGGSASYAETVGVVTVSAGVSILRTSQAAVGQSSVLTLSGLARSGSGAVNFIGTGLGDDARNKVVITGQSEGALPSWVTVNGLPAYYSNARGVYSVGPTQTQTLAARGPSSIIQDNADAMALITSPGEVGPIELAAADTTVAGVIQQTTTPATISMTGKVLRARALSVQAGQAGLSLSGGTVTPAAADGTLFLNNDSTADLQISAVLADNGSASTFGKSGSGRLTLSAANTFSGNLTVQEGSVLLDHAEALRYATLNAAGPGVEFSSAVTDGVFYVGALGSSGQVTLQNQTGSSVMLRVAGDASTTFSGTLSGSGGLIKAGSGTLTLTTPNAYTGGTRIESGRIVASDAYALGTGSVWNDGTLDLVQARRPVVALANGLGGSGTINVTISNEGGDFTQVLNGNYAGYTGTWNLLSINGAAGRVQMNGQDNPLATVNVQSNVLLLANGTQVHTAALNLFGGNTGSANGQLRIEGNAEWAGPITLMAPITDTNDAFFGAGNSAIISGHIRDNGTNYMVRKLAGGYVTFANPTNAFTGQLWINENYIRCYNIRNVGQPSCLGQPMNAADGTIRFGYLNLSPGLYYMGFGDTTDRTFDLFTTNGTTTIDYAGQYGTLVLNGDVISSTPGNKRYQVQGSSMLGTVVQNGVINNPSSGSVNIWKSGWMLWVLNNDNLFTGDVYINQGPLKITRSGALGVGSKKVSIVTGNRPQLLIDGSAGDITLTNTLAFVTSCVDVPGIVNVAGSNTIQGPVELTDGNGSSTYEAYAGSKLTFTGVVTPSKTSRELFIRGEGDIEFSAAIVNGSTAALPVRRINGTGVLTLTAANTFTGVAQVDAGSFVVKGVNGAIGGGVVVNGGSFRLENTVSENSGARIPDSATLTLNGGEFRLASDGNATVSETLGNVTVQNGANVITVDGAAESFSTTLALGTLTRSGSGSVNFMIGPRGKVTLSGQSAGALPAWVRINGQPASYSTSEGVIAFNDSYTDIPANGAGATIQSNSVTVVRINQEGTEGGSPIALDATTTDASMIIQDSLTDATVDVAGKRLRIQAAIINPEKADLTIGVSTNDGALAPLTAGGALSLVNNNTSSVLQINATLANNATASTLEKAGLGKVRLTGSVAGLTGIFSVGQGELSLAPITDITLSNELRGAGSFVKEGTQTVMISRSNISFYGPMVVREGVLKVNHNEALGSREFPTIVEANGTLDFAAPSITANNLNVQQEPIYVAGSGVNGRGALINSSANSQYNAMRVVRMTGDATFGGEHGNGRLDIRGLGETPTQLGEFSMNDHTLTCVGSNIIGVTNVRLVPGGNNAAIDIREGSFSTESGSIWEGSAANLVTVRSNAAFDIYVMKTPIAWSMNIQDSGAFYSRQQSGTNYNIWAGPITLQGRAYFTGASGSSKYISGSISGPGTLIKTNASGAISYLAAANSYEGGTIVNSGTLYAYMPAALPGYADAAKVRTDAPNGMIGLTLGAGGWSQADWSSLYAALTSAGRTAGFYLDLKSDLTLASYGNMHALTKYGTATLTLDGTSGVSTNGQLNLYAGANIMPAGSVNTWGNTYLRGNGSTLVVSGTYSSDTNNNGIYLGNGSSERVTMTVNEGADIQTFRLFVGNSSLANAALIQKGGYINVGNKRQSTDLFDVANNGAYGYFRQEGGTLSTGQFGVPGAGGNMNMAVVDLFAGNVDVTIGWLIFGWSGGNGIFNIFNAQVKSPTGNDVSFHYTANRNSFSMLNLLGPTGLLDATGWGRTDRGLNMAYNSGNGLGIVNLNAGTLLVNRVYAANGSSGSYPISPSYFNFNGGTLKAFSSRSDFMQGLSQATVYEQGAVIDCVTNVIKIGQPLLAPTGYGVSQIVLQNPGVGYIGAPQVFIQGGSGVGATAIALVNLNPQSVEYGRLTGFVVTSPGFGYQPGDTLKVTLLGGGYTTLGQATAVLSANVSGGLTKRGSGPLTLLATNTLTGLVTIDEGALMLPHTSVLPATASVRVNAAGLYCLGLQTITNKTVSVYDGGRLAAGQLVADTITFSGTNSSMAALSGAISVTGALTLNNSIPGLYEGLLTGNSFNLTSPNPQTSIQLATRSADTTSTNIWPFNATYVYSGFVWNRTSQNATWTFAENFDDNVYLTIDGNVVLSNMTWNVPTLQSYTLTPGAHAFELRLGQGTGGAGPSSAQWWTRTDLGVGVDFLGRGLTNSIHYAALADLSDGALFTSGATVSKDLWATNSTLRLINDAMVNLGTVDQTLSGLSGSGVLTNGALTVNGTIEPGDSQTIGQFVMGTTATTLSGNMTVKIGSVGACDSIRILQGYAQTSGLTVTLDNPDDLDLHYNYEVIKGATSGAITASNLPAHWRLIQNAQRTMITFPRGSALILR